MCLILPQINAGQINQTRILPNDVYLWEAPNITHIHITHTPPPTYKRPQIHIHAPVRPRTFSLNNSSHLANVRPPVPQANASLRQAACAVYSWRKHWKVNILCLWFVSKQKLEKRLCFYTQKSSYTLATILKNGEGYRLWVRKTRPRCECWLQRSLAAQPGRAVHSRSLKASGIKWVKASHLSGLLWGLTTQKSKNGSK